GPAHRRPSPHWPISWPAAKRPVLWRKRWRATASGAPRSRPERDRRGSTRRIQKKRHGAPVAFRAGRASQVYDGPRHRPTGEPAMDSPMFPPPTAGLAKRRAELAPEALSAFKAFSKAVFAPGALDAKTKQLIAVAVAHVTQCPYCIKGHTEGAARAGASDAEIMEAIWVAAEMRAGGAYAHSALALQTLEDLHGHGHGPA